MEPWVVFRPEVASFEQKLRVDTDHISVFLQQTLGWTAAEAAIHLEFSGHIEFQKRYEVPDIVAGAYSIAGATRTRPSANDSDELLSHRHGIAMPISAANLSPTSIARLNHIFRHEVGHAVCKNRFGEERLYHSLLGGKDGSTNKGKALGYPGTNSREDRRSPRR